MLKGSSGYLPPIDFDPIEGLEVKEMHFHFGWAQFEYERRKQDKERGLRPEPMPHPKQPWEDTVESRLSST